MKVSNLCLFLICVLGFSSLHAQNSEPTMDSLSYSVGVLVAQNLQQQGLDEVNAKDLAAAIKDVLEGNPLKIEAEEANHNLQNHMMAKRNASLSANVKKGQAFLAENAKKEGVKTTASGLQYKVITAGAGNNPAATDEVTVHYAGTTIDGTEFDSSYKRGEPTSFPLNRVIAGWTEGLQLMKVGAKYRFFIPSNLAYGEQGAGGSIGPNETLIFDVELLGINGQMNK